ncbi:LOW QUALITY PROTEIN: hypothetical protein PFAG_05470 [Plasmodium falciparum Santa Lucia]|uniref:Uncharacterized protein n=4 Tax=Plasmodium falciparum TaxID=5833 RepID=W4IW59_PLAFP|nr:LOW QUALITY PROTEIN: hypothetical protein PFNF135_05914 [Plasmodium falciparum NF135/5.C10]ETW54034.1 LOW QUALITY PROTEIN: hypothetical protein PFUGPA_03906 [Plasmodium falciparum Palo Alto/Uganda]EUT78893.1 LOW QUALITY PROTEIN: hypothetical protein PFAG_05470 [Plasmodium falciparum Santa Lucia]EWC73834.1 LOW QUALITY PROTEIN: hypothetical protein C923_05498 [Plasmodium falciparum UGT5.1]
MKYYMLNNIIIRFILYIGLSNCKLINNLILYDNLYLENNLCINKILKFYNVLIKYKCLKKILIICAQYYLLNTFIKDIIQNSYIILNN